MLSATAVDCALRSSDTVPMAKHVLLRGGVIVYLTLRELRVQRVYLSEHIAPLLRSVGK